MKTIQMTIDEQLLDQVDASSAELGVDRSAFIREALRQAMAHLRATDLERQHAAGYARHPVKPGEFDLWEGEQVWGES